MLLNIIVNEEAAKKKVKNKLKSNNYFDLIKMYGIS